MDVADLTEEGFVLKARGRRGGRGQPTFDPLPGEGLDGAPTASGLQHRPVLRA